jgi:hypothetical protein
MTDTRAPPLLVKDDDLVASVMTEILALIADVRWASSAWSRGPDRRGR